MNAIQVIGIVVLTLIVSSFLAWIGYVVAEMEGSWKAGVGVVLGSCAVTALIALASSAASGEWS